MANKERMTIDEIIKALNQCYEDDESGFIKDDCKWTACPYYEHDNCQMNLREDLLRRMKEYKKIREAWIRMHEEYSKIMKGSRR